MFLKDNPSLRRQVENLPLRRAAPGAHSVRRGVVIALAGAPRGYPRNRLSVSPLLKPVRFSGLKRSAALAGKWKLDAAAPGLGEGCARG